jgi:hypothetical protein
MARIFWHHQNSPIREALQRAASFDHKATGLCSAYSSTTSVTFLMVALVLVMSTTHNTLPISNSLRCCDARRPWFLDFRGQRPRRDVTACKCYREKMSRTRYSFLVLGLCYVSASERPGYTGAVRALQIPQARGSAQHYDRQQPCWYGWCALQGESR